MTKQAKICIIILVTLSLSLLFLFALQKIVMSYNEPVYASKETAAKPATYNVTLYILPSCGYCTMAKALLDKYNIEYNVIDISDSPILRQKLVDTTKQKTVPMIFINEEFVGGYSQLLELERQGFFK